MHLAQNEQEERQAGRRDDGEAGRVGVGNNLRLSSLDLSRSWLGTPQAHGLPCKFDATAKQPKEKEEEQQAGKADGASQANEAKEPQEASRGVEKPKSILVAVA